MGEIYGSIYQLLKGVGLWVKSTARRKVVGVISAVPKPAQAAPQPQDNTQEQSSATDQGTWGVMCNGSKNGVPQTEDHKHQSGGDDTFGHRERKQSPKASDCLHDRCHTMKYPKIDQGRVFSKNVEKKNLL